MPTAMAGRAAKLRPQAARFRRGQRNSQPTRFSIRIHAPIWQGEH
jgi:hypothetical protein